MNASHLARFCAGITLCALSLLLSGCAVVDALIGWKNNSSVQEQQKENEQESTVFQPDSGKLDPRYAVGAFGAWHAPLHVDADDRRALGVLGDDQLSSARFTAWLSPDGRTIVVAYNLLAYPTTLTAYDVTDGSQRWFVNLAAKRTRSSLMDHVTPADRPRLQCLPELVDGKIACSNVGLIDADTGEVTAFEEGMTFEGSYSHMGKHFVFAQYHGEHPGISAWDLSGEKQWEQRNKVFVSAAIGQGFGVVTAFNPANGAKKTLETIDLESGEVLSTVPVPDVDLVERASATNEGVGVVMRKNHQARAEDELEVWIYPAKGGDGKRAAEGIHHQRTEVSLSLYSPRVTERTLSVDELAAMAEGTRKVTHEGQASFVHSAGEHPHVDVFAPQSMAGAVVPATMGLGITSQENTVIGLDYGKLSAWDTKGKVRWQLPVIPSDGWPRFQTIRAGAYIVRVEQSDDWKNPRVTFIAPGVPGNAELPFNAVTPSGEPLRTWDKPGIDNGTTFPLGAAVDQSLGISLPHGETEDLDGNNGASSHNDPAAPRPQVGSEISNPESNVDSSQLDQVAVQDVEGSGEGIIGLQEFANDLAAGRFDKIRTACWTMSDSSMDRQYFDARSRQYVLEALSKPGKRIEGGAVWKSSGGNVVANDDELTSPYACPVFHPDGVADPVTPDDAKLLLKRAIGVANDKPIRSGDNGHYELQCDRGGAVGRNFAVHLENVMDGPLSVQWESEEGTTRIFRVKGSSSAVQIRQDTRTSAICLVDR